MERPVVGAAFMLIVWMMAAGAAAREVPPLGVILNDDGDFSFTSPDPRISAHNLRASIDALAGTPVGTLIYCVGAGSDVLYYPTEVASVWGWRTTKYDQKKDEPQNEDDLWPSRIQKVKTGMQAGVDPIRVAGEHAKAMGLYFFPSYRMNDDHFMFDPFEYPLTGEFWIRNHERLIIGTDRSPILSDHHYGNLLDFSHREVRQFRLAVIREVIERYEDIMDGIELDFNRVQILFPRGKGPERAHLVTDLVSEVRTLLDEAGQRRGRELYLVARVPPTLRNCRWAGLEVEKWIEQRLIDVVSPAQLMTLAHDMPVDEFVRLARPVGCRVYPSLYPRTSYGWPIPPRSPPRDGVGVPDYSDAAQREVTPELVRGAAANYWMLGADGFYLFNFHHEDRGARPYSDRIYRILRDLAGPAALNRASKEFAITPGYYLDHEDSYQNRKQIPLTLKPNDPQTVWLLVGEDLQDSTIQAAPPQLTLRLGFDRLPQEAKIELSLNGRRLPAASESAEAAAVVVTAATPAPAPGAYLQVDLPDASLVHQGRNEIIVVLGGEEPDAQVELREVRLGVFYDRKYLDMLFE